MERDADMTAAKTVMTVPMCLLDLMVSRVRIQLRYVSTNQPKCVTRKIRYCDLQIQLIASFLA